MNTIGELLANMAIEGAKVGPVAERMCMGCAFKKGTPANGELPAAERALECLLTDNLQFNCHIYRDRVCGGYLLAKQAPEQ